MSRRRHKKHHEEQLKQAAKTETEKGLNLPSMLKKINFLSLSGQLRDIADNMEKFGQFAQLFEHMDVFINPNQGDAKSGFNLMNLLKNGDALNLLIQTLTPNLQDVSGEKKVEPLNVETHPHETHPSEKE